MQPLRLLKLPQVKDRTGYKDTTVYGQAKAGLFPPPVKLTPRSSGWPEHEVSAVIAARIAGKTDAEIKVLVTSLVAARASLLAQVTSAA
jgi:prophage regulatory protein